MSAGAAVHSALMHVLVVDDEAPAREELSFLLRDDPRVGTIRTAASAGEALRVLAAQTVDIVFCDIKMPGLDGIELARVIGRFAKKPQIVFVTAYDDHAVDAFDLQAIDYLVKPVHGHRLAESVRRAASAGSTDAVVEDDETVVVELAGVTRFVRRSQVRYVEAQGDYVRLHTSTESHLVRITLAELEAKWAEAGFVRIHRSTLVALGYVDEIRTVDGHSAVHVDGVVLPVSRRHNRELRDRLSRR